MDAVAVFKMLSNCLNWVFIGRSLLKEKAVYPFGSNAKHTMVI